MKLNPLDYAPYKIGDKVGQMFAVKQIKMEAQIVEELDATSRNDKGFGSTGK